MTNQFLRFFAQRHSPPSNLTRRLARLAIAWVYLTLPAISEVQAISWHPDILYQAPQVFPVETPAPPGMRAVFFEGLPWKGKPTRVFAWIGLPAEVESKKLPAIVLVHGGGGTAFADWVKLWTNRGYAAIAIDTCGSFPSRGFGEPPGMDNRPRHEFAGPPCWDASFDQVDWPIEDQWTYQAVADIILANSLLRSFPQIDPTRIGITGISWGGYLTAIAASVDTRFRFAVPVYGCGFLGDDSVWVKDFEKNGRGQGAKVARSMGSVRLSPACEDSISLG